MIENALIRAPRLLPLFLILICAAFGSAQAVQETAAAEDFDAVTEQISRLEQLALSRLRGGAGIANDTAEEFSDIVKTLGELQKRRTGQGTFVSLEEVESLLDRIAELRLEMRASTGSRTSSSRRQRTLEANDDNARSSARSSASDPEEVAVAEPPVPVGPIVVPAKTKLTVQLRSWLSSKDAEEGEIFHVRVDEDVTDLQDRVLIPERTVFEGHVVEAKGAGLLGSAGKLVLRLDKLLGPEEQSIPAAARVVGLSRGSDIAGRSSGDVGGLAGEVAGEAVEDNVLDSGDPKKAAVGGGVDLALSKGGDVFLRSGTKLLVVLDHEVKIPWKWPERSSSRRRR